MPRLKDVNIPAPESHGTGSDHPKDAEAKHFIDRSSFLRFFHSFDLLVFKFGLNLYCTPDVYTVEHP